MPSASVEVLLQKGPREQADSVVTGGVLLVLA